MTVGTMETDSLELKPQKPKEVVNRPPCFWNTVNPFSFLFFSFPVLIMKKGRDVSEDDLPSLLACEKSVALCARYEKEWNKNAQTKRPSALWALFCSMRKTYLLIMFIEFLEVTGQVGLTVILGMFLQAFREGDAQLMILAASIFGCLVFSIVVLHAHYFTWMLWHCTRMRHAVQTLLFKKCMHLSLTALGQFGQGKIVNLYSSELWRIEMGSVQSAYIVLAPFHLLLVSIIAYLQVGTNALYGSLLMCVFASIQFMSTKIFRLTRSRIVRLADKRVNLMKELLMSVKMIKMYAWEAPFSRKMATVRNEETGWIMTSFVVKALNSTFSSMGAFAVVAVIVFIETGAGNTLDGATLFPLFALFSPLQLSLSIFLPHAFEMGSDLLVADKRLTQLFLIAEQSSREKLKVHKQGRDENAVKNSIECADVCYSWGCGGVNLRNITFTVPPTSLTIITGKVGCGKSTLCLNLLGEVAAQSGRIAIHAERVAYCAQEPFLLHGSVEHNIMASAPWKDYDPAGVHRAVQASGMTTDLKMFSNGLQTELGERGINLSGGQKSRLALARALYSDADVYILDDPLSALDTKVQCEVFRTAILQDLADKTVLLVTHQVHLLSECLDPKCRPTMVIVMEEGEIVRQGPVGDFVDYFNLKHKTDDGMSTDQTTANSSDSSSEKGNTQVQATFVAEEARMKRGVPLTCYWKYWRVVMPSYLLVLFLGFMLCAQGVFVFAQYYLTMWASKTPIVQQEPRWTHYLAILLAASWTCLLLNSFTVLSSASLAARRLHNAAFTSVMFASMHFFDQNPLGRILNRFSKDIGLMDDMLPMVYKDAQSTLLSTMGIVTLVCMANPYVFIAVVPLLLYSAYARRFYLAASQPLKRIDAVTRSPIFTQLSTMLQSLPTIRAYHLQHVAIDDFHRSVDVNFSALATFKYTERWFGIRLDFVSAGFQMFALVSALILRVSNADADAQWVNFVSLSLAYSMQLSGMFQWSVRQTAEVQNQMVSTERILEYTEVVPEESKKASCLLDVNPRAESVGDLQFEDVHLRYALNSPLVLKGVTFHLQPGESCGVVGRSGAGKSSLLIALFRLTPYEGGRILLDGQDIAQLPLRTLRSMISIIPQSPTIFTGSVAYNLDPFGQFAKEELWHVLKQVQLYDAISRLPLQLDAELAEDENSLSIGERQCLCLARAFLRKNKFFALDEATANVDLETDQLIQGTIRQESSGATTLTIAHRLETIIHNDKIVVMDFGRVAEFGAPADLLADDKGLFSALAWRIRDAYSAGDFPPRLRTTCAGSEAQDTYVAHDAGGSRPRSCACAQNTGCSYIVDVGGSQLRESNPSVVHNGSGSIDDVENERVSERGIILVDTTEALDQHGCVDI